MDSPPNSGITGSVASDQSLEFRENLTQHRYNQQQTDVCSSASSDEMPVIFFPPSKNIPVEPTASVIAASGSQTSPQEGGNTRQVLGPSRHDPIRLNSLVYSSNMHAVLLVVEHYRNGKVRLQDPHNPRRRSRESQEREFYEATDERGILITRGSNPNDMLDESRTAIRQLFADVISLEKKNLRGQKLLKSAIQG